MECMWLLQNIAVCDYQESDYQTDRHMDRQMNTGQSDALFKIYEK